MSRTVTLRLDDEVYRRFRLLADADNRPLSNFIETAVLRYLEADQFVDAFEMDEIRSNPDLNESMKRGLRDAGERRGRFL